VGHWLAENGRTPPSVTRGGLASIPQMFEAFKAGIHYFGEETYAGNPAAATAELGEKILDTLAGHAGEALGEILDGALPPEEWHSPFWKLRHVFVNPAAVRIADALLRIPRTVS
jgi:hypothetical protein